MGGSSRVRPTELNNRHPADISARRGRRALPFDSMRYILIISLTLAACFGMQTLALRAVGGRTTKSESNFFSSLGRIQAGAQDKPEAMILGSSVTGRLPDRAQGIDGWANMGCDGGSAVDALRAIDEGILPSAPFLVIEANTLQLALKKEPTEIGQAMRAPWFKVGLRVSALSAYARPAAFFYSKLLARRIGDFAAAGSEADLGVSSRPREVTDSPQVALTQREEDLIDEVAAIVKRLKANGSRTVIVWLPPARGDQSPPPAWILELARRSEAPYWDLGQEAAPGTVTLTDGVHMAASSAARTMTSLQRGLRPEP